MVNKKFGLFAGIALAGTVFLAGCGEEAAEPVTDGEEAVEPEFISI